MKLENRYGLNMVVDYQQQGELHAIVVHGMSGNRHQKHIQKLNKDLEELIEVLSS